MILALLFSLILIELSIVGWIDLKTKKISNRWALLNGLSSVALHFGLRSHYPLTWEIIIFPVGFIVIGFILFLFGVMGAGDSKFLASLFLIIPLEYHFPFFEKLILVTIVTGASLLIFKAVKSRREMGFFILTKYWEGLKQLVRSRFSYAPVIVVAWILLGFHIWT